MEYVCSARSRMVDMAFGPSMAWLVGAGKRTLTFLAAVAALLSITVALRGAATLASSSFFVRDWGVAGNVNSALENEVEGTIVSVLVHCDTVSWETSVKERSGRASAVLAAISWEARGMSM